MTGVGILRTDAFVNFFRALHLLVNDADQAVFIADQSPAFVFVP